MSEPSRAEKQIRQRLTRWASQQAVELGDALVEAFDMAAGWPLDWERISEATHKAAQEYEFRDPDRTLTEAERIMLEDFGHDLVLRIVEEKLHRPDLPEPLANKLAAEDSSP